MNRTIDTVSTLSGERYKGLALLMLLLFFSPASYSATNSQKQWYQIEIFIFASENEGAAESETWLDRDQLDIYYTPNIIELRNQPAQGMSFNNYPFLKLPNDQWLSKDLGKKIRYGRHYRLLYEAAWRQPLEPRGAATPVLIQGGEQFDDYFELEGTVTLSVSRYIHVNTNLWLTKFARHLSLDAESGSGAFASNFGKETIPGGQLSNSDSVMSSNSTPLSNTIGFGHRQTVSGYEAIRTVQLKQSRRMRSGELHYLDHPLFGVLVKVTPFERPEKPEQAPDFEQLPPWENELRKRSSTP